MACRTPLTLTELGKLPPRIARIRTPDTAPTAPASGPRWPDVCSIAVIAADSLANRASERWQATSGAADMRFAENDEERTHG